jgi:hypothetical protein
MPYLQTWLAPSCPVLLHRTHTCASLLRQNTMLEVALADVTAANRNLDIACPLLPMNLTVIFTPAYVAVDQHAAFKIAASSTHACILCMHLHAAASNLQTILTCRRRTCIMAHRV